MTRQQCYFPAQRLVYQSDALAWLSANPAQLGMSIVTSLPDYSELPNMSFKGWHEWFVEASGAVLRWIPPGGCAVFFQTDIRHEHIWIDKAAMIHSAAVAHHRPMLWHKIVCRNPAGTITPGRPGYAHMLCFVNGTAWTPQRPGPDVIADGGTKPWVRAMGVNACAVACRFLRDETGSHTIVDPFCGYGTVLAVANNFGLNSIGIDLSAKRVRRAFRLTV